MPNDNWLASILVFGFASGYFISTVVADMTENSSSNTFGFFRCIIRPISYGFYGSVIALYYVIAIKMPFQPVNKLFIQ